MQKKILTCILSVTTLRRMKHFEIYFWKTSAYLSQSISIQVAFWGASFITGSYTSFIVSDIIRKCIF